MFHGSITADETFAFEHLEHARAQPRGRRGNLGLLAHLRIVNSCDQIAERIIQGHRAMLLTSSTSQGPESGPCYRIHAAQYGSSSACGNTPSDARLRRNDCECALPTNCAATRRA